MIDGVDIRLLETIDDYRACEELQRRVWSMPDDLEVVPVHLLKPMHAQGGIHIGAFDGGRMVGFVFGYLGITAAGQLMHCSHQMGVAPEFQSSGLGYRLKMAQRETALDKGLDLMTWTCDPLQSRNAYLNIHKLGAVCREYNKDYYGAMTDGINSGLPSDRFQVEWWLKKQVHRSRPTEGGLHELDAASGSRAVGLKAKFSSTGVVVPGEPVLDAKATTVLVEIPSDYGAVKAASPELALTWRLKTRAVLLTYLGRGYTAAGFESWMDAGRRRSQYELVSDWRPL